MHVAVRTLKCLLVAALLVAGPLALSVPVRPVFAAAPKSVGCTSTTAKTDAKDLNDPCSQSVTCLNGVQVANDTKDGQKVPSGTDCALKSGDCSDPSNCDLIQHYINPAIDFTAALVGVAVVASIIIGGIQYSSAGGNMQAVSAAKARIRNAIIALVAFALLYAMLDFLIPGGLV